MGATCIYNKNITIGIQSHPDFGDCLRCIFTICSSPLFSEPLLARLIIYAVLSKFITLRPLSFRLGRRGKGESFIKICIVSIEEVWKCYWFTPISFQKMWQIIVKCLRFLQQVACILTMVWVSHLSENNGKPLNLKLDNIILVD